MILISDTSPLHLILTNNAIATRKRPLNLIDTHKIIYTELKINKSYDKAVIAFINVYHNKKRDLKNFRVWRL